MSAPPKVSPKPCIKKRNFKSATQTQPPDAVHKAVNSTTLESGNEYDSITEYDYINVGSPASSDKLYVNVGSPSSPDKLVASAVPLNTAIHTLQDQVATLEHSLAKVSTQTSTLQSNLHQLSAQLEVVCSEVKQLKQQVQEQRDEDGSRSSMATNMQEETPVREQNKGYLSSLDHIQVLQLLDKMGLKQYKEKFQEESINGEILVECNSELLRQELKVTSQIHRLRLLKIINGEHSAQKILQGSITTLV